MEFAATIDENATTCRWYLTLNTTNISATALTYTPNVSVNIGSTSFFVESYNENTGCKSSRKEVKAEAFAIPAAPVLSAMSNCGPQQFSISTLLQQVVRVQKSQQRLIMHKGFGVL